MAEALLRRLIEAHPTPDLLRVDSGGVAPYARDGALVSMDARLTLRDEGIPVLPKPTSTDLKRNRHLVEVADLILAMTEDQIGLLARSFPEAEGKPVYTLREFAGAVGNIEDPVGQGDAAYAACCRDIRECLERAWPRLVAGHVG